MSVNIIDGKQVAEKLRERIANAVKKIEQEHKKNTRISCCFGWKRSRK
jgi:5,10-methylene-tetrahydrofolate dehydrogenase/methenyl tetrahydrofolate cyclohydrolase